jgi:hypothetical protein
MKHHAFGLWILLWSSGAMLQAQTPATPDTDSLRIEFEQIKAKNREAAANTSWSHYIIQSEGGGFGYCIMADGHVYIWQGNIPGIPGNQGFESIEKAERCAGLVIQKIKDGESPPTITEEDLKNNQLIHH